MLRQARRAAVTLCAVISFAPACAAGCSEHTFDPCPEPQSSYDIEVDRKTGRTWLKEAHVAANDTSTLARLSASAKNLPAGSLAKATAGEHAAAGWRTQVTPQQDALPPLK